jgi:hypothetical protein
MKEKVEIYSSIEELKANQKAVKRSKKKQAAYDLMLQEAFKQFHHAMITGEPIKKQDE